MRSEERFIILFSLFVFLALVALFCIFKIVVAVGVFFRKRKKQKAEAELVARTTVVDGEIIDIRVSEAQIIISLKGCDKLFVAHPDFSPALAITGVGDIVRIHFIPPQDGGVLMEELVRFEIVKGKNVILAEERIREARKVTVEGMIVDIRGTQDEILLAISACTEVFVAHPKQFTALRSSKNGDVVRIEFLPPLESSRVVMAELVSFLDLTKQAEQLRWELAQLDATIADMKPHEDLMLKLQKGLAQPINVANFDTKFPGFTKPEIQIMEEDDVEQELDERDIEVT